MGFLFNPLPLGQILVNPAGTGSARIGWAFCFLGFFFFFLCAELQRGNSKGSFISLFSFQTELQRGSLQLDSTRERDVAPW